MHNIAHYGVKSVTTQVVIATVTASEAKQEAGSNPVISLIFQKWIATSDFVLLAMTP
jgi:hypothetical protein